MATEAMLTTLDNPWDPFTHYDEWYQWDQKAGYDTPGLLGRVAISSDELSDADQDAAVLDGMQEIIRENVSGMHRMVTKESSDN